MGIGAIGSAAVSVDGGYGYSTGTCASCEKTPSATGAETRQKPPSGKAPSSQLSEEEKQQVAELQERDREVRAHEAAHVAAGGGYVRGGAQFSYQAGPDGKRYAVGGEVSIDTSPVKDNPSATIAKMQTVRGAALAPANPSGQDRSVAAAASSQEAAARQELNSERSVKASGNEKTDEPAGANGGYNSKGRSQPVEPPQHIDMSV